jgi:hypothetical protein
MSAPLCKLLLEVDDRERAIQTIASDPALLEEVRVTLPMIERTIQGGGPDAVNEALAPLVVVFGVGDAARSKAFWTVYHKALGDMPADALRSAADEYPTRPDAEFFPKPGPFRALALKHAAKAYTAVGRARAAAKLRAA